VSGSSSTRAPSPLRSRCVRLLPSPKPTRTPKKTFFFLSSCAPATSPSDSGRPASSAVRFLPVTLAPLDCGPRRRGRRSGSREAGGQSHRQEAHGRRGWSRVELDPLTGRSGQVTAGAPGRFIFYLACVRVRLPKPTRTPKKTSRLWSKAPRPSIRKQGGRGPKSQARMALESNSIRSLEEAGK
jgi:hypothetical protein